MVWPFSKKSSAPTRASTPLYLFNTLTSAKEQFTLPKGVKSVRMYNCGPTVYGRQHIGNLSMFVFTDVLRRTLEYNGFAVKQVINITDVGHLTSDSDEGEDKMSKGLRAEGLEHSLENMKKLGEKYTELFLTDLRSLDIDTSRIEFPRASDYIPAQIAMIRTLFDKSYAYSTKDGVYFDTASFPAYGALGHIELKGQEAGARVAPAEGKRHPQDFALWKFDEQIGWESPWGKGFPGWHIECSAMIRRTLGEQIDIHTGGIEHIAIHHNNEIAQSEAAIGKKPLSRFWLHREHIQFEGGKLAKSAGNVIYLSDIVEKGFDPLALRYLFLGAHYRTPANFSWDALDASSTARSRLSAFTDAPEGGVIPYAYRSRFTERINDDLDTPGALAVLWDMTKDKELSPADIRAGLLDADSVLGLKLSATPLDTTVPVGELSADLQELLKEREAARKNKDFKRSDEIRDAFKERGYTLSDSPEGTTVAKA